MDKQTNNIFTDLQGVDENRLISTKANTLKALKGKLTKGMIEEMYIVLAKDYMEHPQAVTKAVHEIFGAQKVLCKNPSFKRAVSGDYRYLSSSANDAVGYGILESL